MPFRMLPLARCRLRCGFAFLLLWSLGAAASVSATIDDSRGALPGRAEVVSPHGTFDEPCELCHVADGWKKARISKEFDHSKYGFPLEGAHAGTECLFCHTNLDFEKIDSDCVACHQDVHQGEFGTECSACHGTRTFVDRVEQLSLHRETRFPLTGAHSTLDCQQCHRSGQAGLQFVNTPTECFACHAESYAATTSPDHRQAGMGTDCRDCHGMVTWSGGGFDHGETGFPLTGAHRTAECSQCHVGGRFTKERSDCYACHVADYAGTTDPNHVGAGFGTECEACHGTTTWGGADFDHDQSAFPLTGSHRAVACTECHPGGRFAGTNADCYACHQRDYDGAVAPKHVAGAFPHSCESCHGTSSWAGAQFDHSSTGFRLQGAHLAASCIDCHVNNQFSGLGSQCVDCHRGDYDATSNPPHGGAGFGIDCESCHSASTWSGARFDHDSDFFPIYSGKHRRKWDDCQDCHSNSSNYASFSCLGCHPHSDRTKTDKKHRGKGGYRYDSLACYDCHPRGRE